MPDEIKAPGEWWSADEPSCRLPGTLTYTPEDGIALEVIGSFSEFPYKGANIICGESVNGKEYTLRDNHFISLRIGFGCMARYGANLLIEGAALDSSEPIQLSKFKTRISYLEHWMATSAIKISGNLTPGTTFELINPEIPPLCQYKDFTIELLLNYAILPNSFPRTFILSDVAELYVSSNGRTNLASFDSIVTAIRALISLACGRYTSLYDEQGYLDESDRYPIRIVRRRPGRPRNNVDAPYATRFRLPDIKSRFCDVVTRWLDLAERIDPVLDFYLAMKSGFQEFVDKKFLDAISTLEIYHRRSFDGRETSKREFNRRIQDIREMLPEKDNDWLMRKLRYANEISLSQRLEQLVGSCPQEIQDYFPKNTIRRIVNTRNYLVHREPSRGRSAASGRELPTLAEPVA